MSKLVEKTASVQATTRQFKRAILDIKDGIAELDRQTSSVVIGVFGSFIGMGAAYWLSIEIPTTSFTVLSLILAGIGGSAGLLMGRGGRRVKNDRQRSESGARADAILQRIENLPPGTPKDVRAALWELYLKAVEGQDARQESGQQVPQVAAKPSQTDSQLALPPPEPAESIVSNQDLLQQPVPRGGNV
jgi:hypothetical protein